MAILKVDTISGIGTEGPVFEGDIEFTSQNFLTLPKGDTTQRGRGRALIAGGSTPSVTSDINFLNIQSSGRSIDFGDLSHGRYDMSGCSNGTRGVFAGGRDPAGDEIDENIPRLGLGITFIKSLMDETDVTSSPGNGTTVRMAKHI